jgi:hypothetical protein
METYTVQHNTSIWIHTYTHNTSIWIHTYISSCRPSALCSCARRRVSSGSFWGRSVGIRLPTHHLVCHSTCLIHSCLPACLPVYLSVYLLACRAVGLPACLCLPVPACACLCLPIKAATCIFSIYFSVQLLRPAGTPLRFCRSLSLPHMRQKNTSAS